MPTDDDRREVARSCDRCEYRPVCSTRRTCRDFAWCCSAYKKRIDRDALLALADRMEHMAGMGALLSAHGLEMAAASIREALGAGR